MTVRLHVVPSQGDPFNYLFDGDSLLIGRSREADLTIADEFLSRKHAQLFRRNAVWMIRDLGSQNGTWLNGVRVFHSEAPVPLDTVIKLSNSTISLHEVGDEKKTSAPPEKGLSSIFVNATQLLAQSEPSDVKDETSFRQSLERLKLLNEVHRALADSITREDLLDLILDRVFVHLRPQECAIFLRKDDGELYLAVARTLPDLGREHLYSRHLIEEVVEKGMAALVYDAEQDTRFSTADSIIGTGIRSLVAAPLPGPKRVLGMIVMSSGADLRPFSEEDMALLVSLASVASLRIRNLILAEEVARRRRLEEELALARRIQVALLPASLPTVEGYELFAVNHPSRGVSGDFFQVVERTGELVFMIADVSGKGMSASLLTASLEALAVGPIEDGLPPDKICAKLSRMLYRRTPPERYATMFLASLAPANATLCYANAGHNPPLLVHASGEVTRLTRTGLPLGLLPVDAYEVETRVMAPGDMIVIYTDGLTEALNAEEEEYGADRLQSFCVGHRHEPLDVLAQAIQADLEAFAGDIPFGDDRTMVIFRRTATSQPSCKNTSADP